MQSGGYSLIRKDQSESRLQTVSLDLDKVPKFVMASALLHEIPCMIPAPSECLQAVLVEVVCKSLTRCFPTSRLL